MRSRLTTLLAGVLAVVLVWALWNGITRGGQDFRVFHYAGRLALEGRWGALYSEGPDRFLYAPGFAALISPLALLPVFPALLVWLSLTLAAFALAMRALAKRLGPVPVLLAILFSVRPLAIDLRYGQVNLLILSSAVWAMIAWFERVDTRKSRNNLAAAWFFFSFAAFAKIYPLALFAFPVIASLRGGREGRKLALPAIIGATAAGALLLLPPVFLNDVYSAWFDALARKGLPTETHNQSVLAFLVRVFGGNPFYSLGMGGEAGRFAVGTLSMPAIRAIWFLFSLVWASAFLILAWRRGREPKNAGLLAGLSLALCFLPAHLIWKSYFVLGIPLLAAIFGAAATDGSFRKRIEIPAIALGATLAFSSGDFVGPRAAAWIEALSPFLWVHVAATITGYWRLFYPPSRSS